VSSVAAGSTTAAWRSYYTSSSTGSTFLNASGTNSNSLTERYHSSVSGCSPCPSLCDCLKATSSFCCQSSAGSTVLSTEFVRTSVLLGCRSNNVELATETFAWSCALHTTPVFGRLITYLRRSSSHSTGAHSALRSVLGVDALYKLTFDLLTYLESDSSVSNLWWHLLVHL